MKIQVLDKTTKKPIINTKLQLQIKGKDSGYLSQVTDNTGFISLEDKYNGQQLCLAGQSNPPSMVTITNGAVLYVTTATATAGGKTTEKAK